MLKLNYCKISSQTGYIPNYQYLTPVALPKLLINSLSRKECLPLLNEFDKEILNFMGELLVS